MSATTLIGTVSRRRARQLIKSCTLLVGLPVVLHLMLIATHARVGSWLAVVITVAVGVGLSALYNRRVPKGAGLGSQA